MKCPHCKKELPGAFVDYVIGNNLALASDGSYVLANVSCPHEGCEEDLEFYFPLREINGEKI